MLAAISRVRSASVVTHNVADFEGLGLTLINPSDDQLLRRRSAAWPNPEDPTTIR